MRRLDVDIPDDILIPFRAAVRSRGHTIQAVTRALMRTFVDEITAAHGPIDLATIGRSIAARQSTMTIDDWIDRVVDHLQHHNGCATGRQLQRALRINAAQLDEIAEVMVAAGIVTAGGGKRRNLRRWLVLRPAPAAETPQRP